MQRGVEGTRHRETTQRNAAHRIASPQTQLLCHKRIAPVRRPDSRPGSESANASVRGVSVPHLEVLHIDSHRPVRADVQLAVRRVHHLRHHVEPKAGDEVYASVRGELRAGARGGSVSALTVHASRVAGVGLVYSCCPKRISSAPCYLDASSAAHSPSGRRRRRRRRRCRRRWRR